MPKRKLIPAAHALGFIALSALMINYVLFQYSGYNVYKVLDLGLADSFVVGAFLIGQILVLHSVLKSYFSKDFLIRTIITLLAIAVVDASLAFWIHEEQNKGLRMEYAKELATNEDSLLEQKVESLIAIENKNKANEPKKLYWERLFLKDEYISANYQFKYYTDLSNEGFYYYKPFAISDNWGKRQYKIYFPGNCGIELTLKDPTFQSVYTKRIAYKKLENLDQFHFMVVNDSRIVLKNTYNFSNGILDLNLPAIGDAQKVKWRGHDVTVYRHSELLYVVIGEPLSEIVVWWSNFAFFFGYSLFLALLLRGIHYLIKGKAIKVSWHKLPIQYRIQTTILGLTVILFFVIAAASFVFIHANNKESRTEQNLRKAEYIRKKIASNELSHKGIRNINTELLVSWASRMHGDVDLYSASGALLASSFASLSNTPASEIMDQEVLAKISKHSGAIISQNHTQDNLEFFRTYIGISDQNRLLGVAVFSTPKISLGYAQSIPMLMSSLLNVYVTLLLITWLAGLYLTNLLNKPLRLLAKRLSDFKIGQRNDLLDWKGDDAIGSLINEYNKMVQTVELTTQELMEVEREGAWKTMAQQIAHEINNPLTPLKLKIQFLNRAFLNQDKPDPQAIKRITDSLIDQIDQLAGTAEQFKLFAKMGTPKASPLHITNFIKQFEENCSQEYGRAILAVREDDLENGIIQMDDKHFQIVLQNIVQFMNPFLSEEGQLQVLLKRLENKTAILLTSDEMNIPKDEWKTIFDPCFVIKSGQSGLGLPICRRIVEFYGGELELIDRHTFSISFIADESNSTNAHVLEYGLNNS